MFNVFIYVLLYQNMVFDFYDNFSVLFSILELTKEIFKNTLHDICLYFISEFSIQSMIITKIQKQSLSIKRAERVYFSLNPIILLLFLIRKTNNDVNDYIFGPIFHLISVSLPFSIMKLIYISIRLNDFVSFQHKI